MQVFKFGGASVKSAENIKNVVSIVERYKDSSLLIVVSAIGKTTDKLVKVTESYINRDDGCFEHLESLKKEHLDILHELFPDHSHAGDDDIAYTCRQIEWILVEGPP